MHNKCIYKVNNTLFGQTIPTILKIIPHLSTDRTPGLLREAEHIKQFTAKKAYLETIRRDKL
jgi:hypothetical protein